MDMNRETDEEALLDRATAALRDASIPPGPSQSLQAVTLEALYADRGRNRFAAFTGGPSALMRIAAAVAVLAAGIAVYFATSHRVPVGFSRNPTPGSSVPSNPSTAKELLTPQVPAPAAVMATADAPSIVGQIYFDGVPPPRRPIDFSMVQTCSGYHTKPAYDDSLLVNTNGTLSNAVVAIVAGLDPDHEFGPPAAPVVLDQQGCFFEPHVIAMMTRQQVVVRNSDPFLHNVRSTATENERFNLAQYTQHDTTKLKSPAVPEFFQVKCDIHPWMSSWFCVFDHPYFAVTGKDGTFSLKGLPPGHYTLRAWHEKLGKQERQIVVEAGKPVEVDFTFRATQSASGTPSAPSQLATSSGPACPRCGNSHLLD
jgi:hypothetical protein